MEGMHPSAWGSSALVLSGSCESLPVSVPWWLLWDHPQARWPACEDLSRAIHLCVLFILCVCFTTFLMAVANLFVLLGGGCLSHSHV